VRCVASSRYIGTCYGFAHGEPLGSVVQNGSDADALHALAVDCVRILGMTNGVFHFEAIQADAGFVFMEVAARAGGSYLPYMFRDVYGVDFVGNSLRLQLGLPMPPQQPRVATHGGGLVVPEAFGCRVAARRSMLGIVPEIYREILPELDHVFRGHGEYEDVLGTFLFEGTSSAHVEAAIRTAIAEYAYTLVPAQEPELV